MSTIKNNINTYADLTAYNADTTKDYPNVSYIQNIDEVKWVEYDPTYVVAKYNVTSTSSATTLFTNTSNISKMWIDSVEQESVISSYTFSTTGVHTLKIALTTNTALSNNMFNNCSNLISVILPNTLSQINSYAFYNCTGLTKVYIPNGVTTIGYVPFCKCTALTNVIIPSTVTYINEEAFNYCTALSSVTVLATTPPTIEVRVFDQNASGRKIYVPAASVNTYKAATRWSNYASDIEAIPTT